MEKDDLEALFGNFDTIVDKLSGITRLLESIDKKLETIELNTSA